MRAVLLPLTLVALMASPVRADVLALDRPDLHAHLWLSYGLALTLTEVLEGPEPSWGGALGTTPATLIATGLVAALGIFKEYALDERADGADLLADGVGLGLNVVVQYAVPF